MGDSRQGSNLLADAALLDLLHRETDGDLSASEQAQLDDRKADPDVQAARTALRRAVMFLSGPNPPATALPRSIAAAVVADISLSKLLASPSLASPPLPRSMARSVAAEVALSQQMQAVPPLPRSVAASVTSDIQAARQLQPPPLPHSVAASITAEIAADGLLHRQPAPVMPRSVAAALSQRIASDNAGAITSSPDAPSPPDAATVPPVTVPPVPTASRPNPAPLLLVGALLVGVTLLTTTTAWPNLAAGAVVLHTLLTQVSPLAGLGLALLLLTSALVAWKPTPAIRTAGAGAFALAAALTIPALYNVAGGNHGLTIGQNVTVSGPVGGNVIAIGGNINLKPGAQVDGEVVTLLGDVHRSPGSRVGGHIHALLGQVPGADPASIDPASTDPAYTDAAQATRTTPASDLSLATAAAFRPVLGWLEAAAWPRIFVALTGGLLLILFLGGLAPTLARRQRHAPMQALALGILLLALFSLPALALALSGYLTLALMASAMTTLLVALGLSVSIYDAGRALAYRLRLPVPDAVGTMLGLCAFAASQSYGLLAFALTLVGGAWGAGTLLLSRRKVVDNASSM